ncbi:hypothetical protein EHS13_05850 [Paenibacillus psychroresistens]|uniref:Uncharacterized protein n=1 Tax=Paenibacillus psychroresistens TaxID=1778678 RepID=A0A6B8RE15_9BACL|nr:hypothetical protein [Paenibacillus psychroresistens]QGQ94459.1 hypothetical protein EHS13_05850 [Paenibacillus psychroresistens]
MKNFFIGVDNAGEAFVDRLCGKTVFQDPLWIQTLRLLGVEFVIFHYDPDGTREEQFAFLSQLAEVFEAEGMQFILNTEGANWLDQSVDQEGWDWHQGEDGLHYFQFKAGILESISHSPAFAGVMLDEAEHMQLHRGWIWEGGSPEFDGSGSVEGAVNKLDRVFLGETTGKTFYEAEQTVRANGIKLVNKLHERGVPRVLTEHVFPVLLHCYAESGMTAVFKQMKEGWTSVWAALALGAALQYDRELWTCLDLWFRDQYPGHSPQELQSNLLFGYWMGVDRLYVENLNFQGSLAEIIQEEGKEQIRLSPWGEQLQWFTRDYLPSHPRKYTFRELRPEIAIIRFDDTCFGQQNDPFWPDWLYGSKTLKSTDVNTHWLKIWHLLSHGTIPENGLSWNHASYSETPHASFAPMNGVVVFDHKVQRIHLETLRLVFLSGIGISSETISDLALFVDEGLIVLTPPELAPEFVGSLYNGGTKVIRSGRGKWILTDQVLSTEVREEVNSFLGKPDEISYRFGEEHIVFKIHAGDKLEINL